MNRVRCACGQGFATEAKFVKHVRLVHAQITRVPEPLWQSVPPPRDVVSLEGVAKESAEVVMITKRTHGNPDDWRRKEPPSGKPHRKPRRHAPRYGRRGR